MPENRSEATARPSLREALRFWWKLGWISFGGTAAHLAIMQSELVEKRRWIDSDHFFHALSHCMLLPGPEAQQLAIYIGWKLHGKVGGFLAGTLFVLPSTAILLGLSLLYARYGTVWWVSFLFRMLKPIVVALVLRALFQIGRRALRSRLQWFAAIASFLAISLLHIPLPWIMGMIVAMGVMLGLLQRLRGIDRSSSEEKTAGYAPGAVLWRMMRIVGGCAAIGSLPMLLLGILRARFPVLDQAFRLFHSNSLCDYRRLIHRNSVRGAGSRNEILLAKPCANAGRICSGGDNAGTTDYCCWIRRVYGWISSFSRVHSHGSDRFAGHDLLHFPPVFLVCFHWGAMDCEIRRKSVGPIGAKAHHGRGCCSHPAAYRLPGSRSTFPGRLEQPGSLGRGLDYRCVPLDPPELSTHVSQARSHFRR